MPDTWKKFGAAEKPKQGRPPKPKAEKRHLNSVYLSDAEKEAIVAKAEAANVGFSGFMRRAALEQNVQSRIDREARQELKGLAVGVRKLGGKEGAARDDIEETLSAIRDAAKRL